MTPKKVHTSGGSSSSYLLDIFSSHDQEDQFNRNIAIREINDLYHLEEKDFKYCYFLMLLFDAQLKGFICYILDERFPTLMRMVYSNLNYMDGVLNLNVSNRVRKLNNDIKKLKPKIQPIKT